MKGYLLPAPLFLSPRRINEMMQKNWQKIGLYYLTRFTEQPYCTITLFNTLFPFYSSGIPFCTNSRISSGVSAIPSSSPSSSFGGGAKWPSKMDSYRGLQSCHETLVFLRQQLQIVSSFFKEDKILRIVSFFAKFFYAL